MMAIAFSRSCSLYTNRTFPQYLNVKAEAATGKIKQRRVLVLFGIPFVWLRERFHSGNSLNGKP